MAVKRVRETVVSLPSPFGTLLKRYRRTAGLTQEALAERAGYSAVYVGMLERGTRSPLPATARLLAEALALGPRDQALLETAARKDATPAGQPTLPAPVPLVGRARELAQVERHLAGEGPPVLLLAGEPGIGKTRLLDEALRRAPGWGWAALHGGCRRRGDQDPYAPLLEALERHLRTTPLEQRRAALRGCVWLVRLLPELADLGIEPLPPWTVAPAQERRLVFAAVARYLANVAGPAGTLLVLDDLQWAGTDALDLLTALVRPTAPATPPRVIAAYRDTDVGVRDPLAGALADLAHAGLVVRHRLAPLRTGDTLRLLDALLGAAGTTPSGWRETVTQRAGGVPFFVVSWAHAMRARAPEDDGAGAVPWDVAQSIRQRVAALPGLAQEVLRVAAVAGRTAPAALLIAAVEPAGDVLAALEIACAAGLLAEEPEERAYRFAHDLVREVVEADLGTARRIALHRRIAEALEAARGDPPVEALAYHYRRSTAQDRAARYLEEAGDRALARSAHAGAAEHYRTLVDCLEGLGRQQEAAGAREKLANALSLAARYDAALVPLERAAEVYRTAGDLESLARVTAQMGIVHAETGTPDRGIARILPLLEALEARGPTRGASAVLAGLYGALGHLQFFSGRTDEALAAVERAAASARAAGDACLLALSETSRGNALRMVGRVAAAQPVMEEAARLAEEAGDLLTLSGALDNLAWAALARGDFGAARRYAGGALAAGERAGSPARVAAGIALGGTIAFLAGDWRAARAALERAVELQREFGASRLAAYPLAELGRLCLAEGDGEAAARYLEQCLAIAQPGGDLQVLRIAHAALAERDVRAGDPAAARARLLPLLDRPGLEEWQVTELLPVLAWAHLEAGDLAEASATASRAIMRARLHEHRLSLIEALRVQGLVALRQGCWDEAGRVLAEALALARAISYPYGEARVLHLAGLLATGRGEGAAARERLAAALAGFRALGAGRDAAQAEQVLTGL